MDLVEHYKHLFNSAEQERMLTIRKVYNQQFGWFHNGEKPKDRIISLHKEYPRPIVRGKETRKVEFGAKVNKI